MISRRTFISTSLAAGAAMASGPARAQEYPQRPITIVIPFAPGGGTDVVARALAPTLSTKLGQPVVIENVSGAAGSIASSRVARATPDGHTLIMHNVAFALNPGLYAKLPYDTEKDFAPIAMVNYTPLMIVGRKDLAVNNVEEFVAWLKSGKAQLGHPGVGSTGHIAVALLASAVGAKANFIPYRGGGPLLTDIMGGHVDIGAVTLGNGLEPVRSGQVKGIGLTARGRSDLLPDVPSLADDISPTLDLPFWNTLLAPAGTPKAVIDKVHAAFEEAIKDKTLIDLWTRTGIDLYQPEQRTPEGTAALLREQLANWARAIKEAGIEAQQL